MKKTINTLTLILLSCLFFKSNAFAKPEDIRSSQDLRITIQQRQTISYGKVSREIMFQICSDTTKKCGYLGSTIPSVPTWYQVSKLQKSRDGMKTKFYLETAGICIVVAAGGFVVGALAGAVTLVGSVAAYDLLTVGTLAYGGVTVSDAYIATLIYGGAITGIVAGIQKGITLAKNGDVFNSSELWNRTQNLSNDILFNKKDTFVEGGNAEIIRRAAFLHAALLGAN